MRYLLALCLALGLTAAHAQTYKWTDPSGRTVISDSPPQGKGRVAAQSEATASSGDNLPFATKRAMENFPVTLYTAANCTSDCQQARSQLNGRGVPFTEKAIQTAEELAELKQLVGEAYVPTIRVGRQTQRGYDASAYDSLLDLAGYPKTAPYGLKKADEKK